MFHNHYAVAAISVVVLILVSAGYLLFIPPIVGVADQGDYERVLGRVGLRRPDALPADANAWWQVDLGASVTVDSIAIWNRTDCCADRLNDYWVFLSDVPFADGETPQELYNRNSAWGRHETVAPNPSATIHVARKGRYVRVQLGRRAFLSLAEVQVFGLTSSGERNWALHKDVKQSSTFTGTNADWAVDGNTDGDFFHASVTHTGIDKCIYRCYVDRYWTIVPADRGIRLFSTAEIPALLAKELSKTTVLDIRAVALMYVVALIMIVLTLLLSCRSLPALSVGILACGLVLIATDSEYIAYFNSFYGEAAAFVGVLGFVAAAVATILAESCSWRHMTVLMLAAGFLVGSKAQNAVLAPVIAAWMIWLFWSKPPQRYVCLVASFALICFGGFVIERAPAPESNLFNAIYDRAVPNSLSVPTALTELGLPAETIRWKDKQYWEVEDRGRPFFPGNSSRLKLLAFYLRHPMVDLQIARDSLTLNNEVPYIGNFEKEAGCPPYARTSTFTAYDRLRQRLASVWFVFPLLAGNVALIFLVRNRVTSLLSVLGGMALVAFLLGAFYDNEPRKHLFTFNLLFDVVLFADLATASAVANAAYRRRMHLRRGQ